MKPIAICKNEKINPHPFFWTNAWIDICIERGLPYVVLNPYGQEFIEKALQCTAVLWHYTFGIHADAMEASNILTVLEQHGIPVFPNWNTRWHNDDKIAESYILSANSLPTPIFHVFYDLEECGMWLEKQANYPLVAKLRTGSGSNNVRLLKNKNEAQQYAKRMFTCGYDPAPNMLYKMYSKAQSSHDWETVIKRIKRIPDFIRNRKNQKRLPWEKDYCYFQEFIPNDGFDIKLVIIGNKAGYLVRKTRKGDFRASGGGELYYDRSLVTEEIVKSAFVATDKLGAQCMGYDYVVDKRTRQGFIIEMCYGFDWETIAAAGGYWDRELIWHDEPINVPKEIIEGILNR